MKRTLTGIIAAGMTLGLLEFVPRTSRNTFVVSRGGDRQVFAGIASRRRRK